MNPAPCIPIEKKDVVMGTAARFTSSSGSYEIRVSVRTRAQIRKGLLRVWNPGASNYHLWIPAEIHYPGRHRNAGNRWWQQPA